MENYNSKYANFVYDKVHNILINTWYNETSKMTEDEYKKEMLEYATMSTEFKPKGLLMDTSNFNFVQSVDMQEWMAANIINNDIKNGMKRYAILLPQGAFEQVSLEQTVEDSQSAIAIKYFGDRDAAFAWAVE